MSQKLDPFPNNWIFWYISLCDPFKVNWHFGGTFLLFASRWFLFWLTFHPEDGGGMFLENDYWTERNTRRYVPEVKMLVTTAECPRSYIIQLSFWWTWGYFPATLFAPTSAILETIQYYHHSIRIRKLTNEKWIMKVIVTLHNLTFGQISNWRNFSHNLRAVHLTTLSMT
jgi:hypothetical protein